MWKPHFVRDGTWVMGERLAEGWYPWNFQARDVKTQSRYLKKWQCERRCHELNRRLIEQPQFPQLHEATA